MNLSCKILDYNSSISSAVLNGCDIDETVPSRQQQGKLRLKRIPSERKIAF